MNIDDAQKKEVATWLSQGLKLADIQKRLQTDFRVNLTYMEVRFLVDDLKLVPKDPPPKPDKTLDPALPSAGASLASGLSAGSPAPARETDAGTAPLGASKVAVTVDALARPGSMVSGSVTFSDGQSAIWHLDQFGRM